MKRIAAAAVLGTILLALSAYAIQKPAPQANPPQAAPPSQQSQPPQDAPPAQPPAARMPSIDEQVNALTEELNLTGDQPAKVKTILEDQRTQAMTVIGDGGLSRDDKVQKIRGIRENTIAKVRGILNDDQKKKFDQMLGEQTDQAPPKPPEGNPPPK
jgi:hypothetical protein